MSDELSRELLDLLLDNIDDPREDQKERLEKIADKNQNIITMGKDIIHHRKGDIDPELEDKMRLMYESLLDEVLEKLIKNWDDPKKRAMVFKDYRDVLASFGAMRGIKGASLVDKKMRRGSGGETEL